MIYFVSLYVVHPIQLVRLDNNDYSSGVELQVHIMGVDSHSFRLYLQVNCSTYLFSGTSMDHQYRWLHTVSTDHQDNDNDSTDNQKTLKQKLARRGGLVVGTTKATIHQYQ